MKRLLLFALLAAFFVAGCSARSVRIAELKGQPTRYTDKSVRITGTVTNSWGLPLVPFQFYSVDDGSGEISVVSQAGRAPSKGTQIQVRGRVSELATLGGRALGLHIREEDRRVKN